MRHDCTSSFIMPFKHISSIFRLEQINTNDMISTAILQSWRWRDIKEEENERVNTSAVTSDIL